MGDRIMKKEVFYCDRCGCEIPIAADTNVMTSALYYVFDNQASKYYTTNHLCPTCGLVYIKRIKQFLEERKDDRDNN